MAWAAALKTFAKGSVKKIAAKKLLGRGGKKDRRQNVKNVMQQQGEYQGGGALAVRPKNSLVPTQVSDASSTIVPSSNKEGGLTGTLFRIKTTTISIDSLLKKSLRIDKDQEKRTRRLQEKERRDQREKNLEKKDDKDTKPKGMKVGVPKVGFLGMLKNFLVNIVFGWLVLNFMKWMPRLKGVLMLLGNALDGLLDWGGKILNVFATLIDLGYSMVTSLENHVRNLFGDKGVETFNKFTATFTKFMNIALIAGMLGARGGMVGKMFGKGRWGNFGKGNVVGRGLRNIRARGLRVGRRFSRSGVGRFLKRPLDTTGRFLFGKATGEVGKKATRSAATNLLRTGTTRVLGRQGTKALLQFSKRFISPIVKRIPLVGALLDFALNYFVFKESLGKSAFKAIGAGLGMWLGGMLGTLIPVPFVGTAIGAFLGGAGGDLFAGALYDMIFAGKSSPTNNTNEKVDNKTKEKVKAEGQKLKGGFIPRRTMTQLHAGEFVVDADSTVHIRDLLTDINHSNSKSEIINLIRSYAQYESDEGVALDVIIPLSLTNRMSVGDEAGISLDSSGGSSDSSRDILYKQG